MEAAKRSELVGVAAQLLREQEEEEAQAARHKELEDLQQLREGRKGGAAWEGAGGNGAAGADAGAGDGNSSGGGSGSSEAAGAEGSREEAAGMEEERKRKREKIKVQRVMQWHAVHTVHTLWEAALPPQRVGACSRGPALQRPGAPAPQFRPAAEACAKLPPAAAGSFGGGQQRQRGHQHY